MKKVSNMFISFKGVSNDDVGAKLIDMPTRTTPSPRGTTVEIPGMDGAMWLPDGSYDCVTVKANFAIMDSYDEQAVLEWLHGYGDLILGDAPEYYFKRARILNSGTLRSITPRLEGKVISATWTCFPFRFLVDEQTLEFTQAATFNGQGSVRTRPIITVYGNGDINLMVNGNSVLLEDVDDHITLDCEAMMAFKDGVNVSSQVTLMGGDDEEGGDDAFGDEWPSLRPAGGTNLISWTDDSGDGTSTASVSRIVVQPNWRFI